MEPQSLEQQVPQPKHRAGKRPVDDVVEENPNQKARRKALREIITQKQAEVQAEKPVFTTGQFTDAKSKLQQQMEQQIERALIQVGLVGLGVGVLAGIATGYFLFATPGGLETAMAEEPPMPVPKKRKRKESSNKSIEDNDSYGMLELPRQKETVETEAWY